MSERRSTSSPRACSGEAYAAVPTVLPVFVRTACPASFATPKSRIFASPLAVTMIFAGFTSRCTIPASWAA